MIQPLTRVIRMSSRKKSSASSTVLPPLSLAPSLAGSAYSSRASSFDYSRHGSRQSSFVPSASPSKFPSISRESGNSGLWGKENQGDARLDWKLRGCGRDISPGGGQESTSVTPDAALCYHKKGSLDMTLNRIANANKPDLESLFLPKIHPTHSSADTNDLKRGRKSHKKHSDASPTRQDILLPVLNRGLVTSRPQDGAYLTELDLPKQTKTERKTKLRKTRSESTASLLLPDIFTPRRHKKQSTGDITPITTVTDAATDQGFVTDDMLTVEKANSDSSSGSDIVTKKRPKVK